VLDFVLAHGKLLVSEESVAELSEVLQRPKFDRYVAAARRLEFLAMLVNEAEIVATGTPIAACRDPKDDKFLELAVSGQATCIVSGDADLMALHPFRGIPILTPQQFLEQMSQHESQ
jgi:putative PIN family toxin of toxin-antitoxin system